MEWIKHCHNVVPVLMLMGLYLICALDLSDYQTASFRNTRASSAFNHFVSYKQSVYVGAIDALYQLEEDFTWKQTVSTALECEEELAECPNHNKILLIDKKNDRLITCGSKDGLCETRNLADISNDVDKGNDLVVPSGTLTTEAIVAPGPLNDKADVLYVAATCDVVRDDVSIGVFPLTRRALITSIFTTEEFIRIIPQISAFFPIINYVSSFTLDEFSYFVQSQVQDYEGLRGSDTRNIYVSKISHVCHNDGNSYLDSYAEILLKCQGQGSSDDYNLVQAAYVGQTGRDLATSLGLNETVDVLYGVFAKSQTQEGDVPSNQSALCIFKISDIEDAFVNAITGCLRNGNNYGLDYLEGSDCPGLRSLGVSEQGILCGFDTCSYTNQSLNHRQEN